MKIFRFVLAALLCSLLISQSVCADWIHPITNPGVAVDSISRFLVVRDTTKEKVFGKQILSLGDITGDGTTEVLLCRDEGNTSWQNNAYLFYGGRPPDSHFVAELTKLKPSLNYIGDVNGDGYMDFGQYTWPASYQLFWGRQDFDDSADFEFPGIWSFTARAADFDADGHVDLPVSRDPNGGLVDVYRFDAVRDTIPEYTIKLPDSLQHFGSNIVTGDLNGDHIPDLVIAQFHNLDTCVIRFYWGGPNFDTVADYIIKSTSWEFGSHLLYIPDFNGDGYGDLFIGGDGDDPAGIYWGGPGFDGKMDLITNAARVGFVYYGIQSYDIAGDINHDGYLDLIFGHDVEAAALYEVHLYLGGPTTDTIRYSDIYFTNYDVPQYQQYYGSAWLGHEVAGIGDFNGDGIDDFAVRSQTAAFGINWWGEVNFFAGWSDTPTDVPDDPTELPTSFQLCQNHPNPFNPSTTISFDLPKAEEVTLTIYNLLGQEVARPVHHVRLSVGTHSVVWEGGHAPSGIYLYRLETSSTTASRKMLLVR